MAYTPKGSRIWTKDTTTVMTNISQIPGSVVGDKIVYRGTTATTILGKSVTNGDVIQITGATTGIKETVIDFTDGLNGRVSALESTRIIETNPNFPGYTDLFRWRKYNNNFCELEFRNTQNLTYTSVDLDVTLEFPLPFKVLNYNVTSACGGGYLTFIVRTRLINSGADLQLTLHRDKTGTNLSTVMFAQINGQLYG